MFHEPFDRFHQRGNEVVPLDQQGIDIRPGGVAALIELGQQVLLDPEGRGEDDGNAEQPSSGERLREERCTARELLATDDPNAQANQIASRLGSLLG